MNDFNDAQFGIGHEHIFLGPGHEKNERKTWVVIALCSTMMIVEIIGGSMFGSLALVADGLHMSTHAGAMLIAALAYTYARKHANDSRFVFGTGKLGDLAGFTSAIVLAMIAILIGYEAVSRFLSPVPIHFDEAIPIAAIGLVVNIASAWLLSGGDHHGHVHGKHEDRHHAHDDDVQPFTTPAGNFVLSIFEEGVSPIFRLKAESENAKFVARDVTVTTFRPGGERDVFAFRQQSTFLESTTAIPEPHAFKAVVTFPDGEHTVTFEEHCHDHDDHGVDVRDHNMRAAYIHVMADAAVSVLAIIGLLLAKSFGWLWMDPLAGIVGALVIANWSYGLVRDTGAILMDIRPDNKMADKVRTAIESVGDRLTDLHVWRLGPGHLAAVVSVATADSQRESAFYHAMLRKFTGLSHITVEVHSQKRAAT